MKNNKTVNILTWVASVVALVLAILCAIFALNSEELFTQIILFFVAALFVVLAGMVGYLAYVDTFKVIPGKKAEARALNYFLNYNGKKRGIAVEELTFEIIDKQMNNFIIDAWGTPVALWKNSVFSADSEVLAKRVFSRFSWLTRCSPTFRYTTPRRHGRCSMSFPIWIFQTFRNVL